MDPLVNAFFAKFEQANATSDVTTIATLYADTFLFAGPKGSQAVKKEDFLKVIPKMKAHFASLGLSGTRLQSVESSAIDSRYMLAKVAWKLTLQQAASTTETLDAFATYVLERKDGDLLSIIVQIDHQDLAALIKSRSGQ